MSALEAARMGDQIGHSSAWAGLLTGALVGLAIGAAILFTVVTGGAGAVLIAAAVAGAIALGAGGALAGMEIGKMFSGSDCSAIKTGSPNTIIEHQQAARAGVDQIGHRDKLVAQGSSTVFVNGAPLGRRTEKCQCGGVMKHTCVNTFIGGDTVTVCPVDDEVPSWLVNALKWTAWIAGGAALILSGAGAVMALGWGAGLAMTALGVGGSLGGGWLGGKLGQALGGLFGARGAKVGEILGEFGGSLLGGLGAAKLGETFGLTPAEETVPGKAPPTDDEVANAKAWAQDKMENTPIDDSHAKYTPEQLSAAKTELDALNRANYDRVQAGELEHPNATPEELKMAVEGPNGDGTGRVPLTYKDNPEAFQNLQSDLNDTFAQHGITDATVEQIGSGTTGWKNNPAKYLDWQEKVANGETTEPWETYGAWKPTSDTDLSVFSDQILPQAQAVDAPVKPEYGTFKNGGGFGNSPIGQDFQGIMAKYNEQIYGSPNPTTTDGFDIKVNVNNQPFSKPPVIYQGPNAPGAAPPPNVTGIGGTIGGGTAGAEEAGHFP